MKLPNIEYKQRKALATIDPSAYVSLGRAQAKTSEAFADIGRTVENVYNRESVSEMQDAYLSYSEQMDIYGEQQTSYVTNPDSGEREAAWKSGPQQFENYETSLRDSISAKLSSPLARRLFHDKAKVLNVKNKKQYRGKLQTWQKEHEVAGVYTRLNRQVDNKKFDDARDTVTEAYTVDTISEPEAAKEIIRINYDEKYYKTSLEVDALESPDDAIKFKQRISDGNLKPADKNKIIAATDDKYINAHRETMADNIIEAELVNGSKEEGYAVGKAYFEKIMRTSPEKLGGDAQFKEQVLGTALTILNRYKPEVIKQTAEYTRYRDVSDYKAGRRIAGTVFNEQMHDDSFSFDVLKFKPDGKSGFERDFENENAAQRSLTDQEILNNKEGSLDKFVGYSAETGHMPTYMRDMLNASLTHNNAEFGQKATSAAYKLSQENPYALWRDGKNNDLTQVATLSEMMGGSPDSQKLAFSLWKQSQNLSPDQRKALVGSKKDMNTYFDDNFNEVMQKQYGDRDSAFFNFWTQTTPDVRQQYKVAAREMMNNYTVINKGNLERGLQSAIISMKGSYHPTTVNGGYTMMKNAPEFAVKDGDKNGGEWLAEQLKQDVQSVYGEDVNMEQVRIEPVDKWNPDDPAYKIYQTTDDGMLRMLGITKFDYSLSGEYKENEAELKKLDDANKRTNEIAQKREQWDIDHPPHLRKRDKTGIEVNPYGVAPSLSAVGKAYRGQAKGIRAQASAAKVSRIEAKKIRTQMDKDKAKADAAKPRPNLGRWGPQQ